MSNHRAIVVDGVLLGREHWDVPVRVELRSFLRFSRRIDSELRRLVVRWAHAASPTARRRARHLGKSRHFAAADSMTGAPAGPQGVETLLWSSIVQ